MSVSEYFDGFTATQFVNGIHEVGNQYGYLNSRTDLFSKSYTNQLAIMFDRDYTSSTLLPQVKRGERSHIQGTERKVDTFAIGLGYFKYDERITNADIQGKRQAGMLELETLDNVTKQKMEDMRNNWDQSTEYMKLQAIKGVSKSPDGAILADMYSAFGITQKSVDLQLSGASTNVDAKINEFKSHIAKNIKQGGKIGGVEALIDPVMFDKLINHPNIRSSYNYYINNGLQVNRDDVATYEMWGIMNHFNHKGVTFLSYDADFALPNGTSEKAFADNTGIALPIGAKDLFRSVYGPSAKLDQANEYGQELFIRPYLDPRGEALELELESAPLFYATKPNAVVGLTTT